MWRHVWQCMRYLPSSFGVSPCHKVDYMHAVPNVGMTVRIGQETAMRQHSSYNDSLMYYACKQHHPRYSSLSLSSQRSVPRYA